VLAAPGVAQAEPGWTVTGALGAVSDYRWRGVSQTDGDPAIQGQINATGPGGIYITGWASNVARWEDADGRPAPASGPGRAAKAARGGDRMLELSATLGRTFELGRYRVDVAIARYGYPGGPAGYLEIPVEVSRSFGRANLTAGFAWTPPQPGTGGRGDRYAYLTAAWADERWPLQPRVSLGHEQGAFGQSKIDWSAGIAAACGKLGFSLDFVGAGQDEGSALVAAVQRRF
jgi:uncharacterized protein (TIGR02001 family)